MRKSALFGAAALILGAVTLGGAAQASDITVIDGGQVNPSSAGPALPSGITVTNGNNAPLVVGTTIQSNPWGFSNYSDGTVGWNPWGSGNQSNQWISVGGANGGGIGGGSSFITFTVNAPANSISFVWGSSSGTNLVSLYSGANGTGTLLGTVSADGSSNLDITSNTVGGPVQTVLSNANLANTTDPGALITIKSDVLFQSAVFSDSSGGFEIGQVSAVPIPAALPMFGTALIGLGALARRRRKKA